MTESPPLNVSAPLPSWVFEARRSCDDPRSTARSLRAVLESHADESERAGQLADETVQAICASGLLGLLMPRELGGIEADPSTCLDVIEELSYADGSAGWVTMATTFAISNAGALLGDSAIDAIFGRRNGFVVCGYIGPNGVAERVEGGYRVRGQFHFGSGAQLASWFLGAFVLHEHGAPAPGPDGRPQIRWMVGPRDRVFADPASWDVAGLRATASYDFLFTDQFVADDFVIPGDFTRRRGGPAVDVGVSMGHLGVPLGIATRILDELQALARSKQRVGRATLIDQPTFQRDFGLMQATLDAARSHARTAFDDWYRDAQRHGTASLDVRARARLAACWGNRVSAEVAEFAYRAAGSDGLRNDASNVLQRCFRDLEAATIHRHVDDNVLIDSTAVLLGVAPAGLQL